MQQKKNVLVDEINTGTYCFDNEALFEALEKFQMIMYKENIIYRMSLKFLKNEGANCFSISNS